MFRLITIAAMACVGAAACGSQHPSPANTSGSSSPAAPTTTSTTVPRSASSTTTVPPVASSTPDCVGLSICPPARPDAEGNPQCYYSDGWQANSAGAGIEIWYFHEPQNLSKPDKA